MNILITGSSGFLGFHLTESLLGDPNYQVFTLDRVQSYLGAGDIKSLLFGPISSREKIFRALDGHSFDAIVHCAAMSSFGKCEDEPSEAEIANVQYSEALVEFAEAQSTYLTFISTDLVYDGNPVPQESGFSEDEIPTPRSVYAATKLAAEKIVLESNVNSSVLRSCLLYGSLAGKGGGPLKWLVQALRSEEEIPVFYDEWRTPLWVGDLVRTIEFTVKNSLNGLYHCGGPERVNRVEFAQKVAKQCELPLKANEISRLSISGPERPEDVSLDSSAILALLDRPFLNLTEGLDRSLSS